MTEPTFGLPSNGPNLRELTPGTWYCIYLPNGHFYARLQRQVNGFLQFDAAVEGVQGEHYEYRILETDKRFSEGALLGFETLTPSCLEGFLADLNKLLPLTGREVQVHVPNGETNWQAGVLRRIGKDSVDLNPYLAKKLSTEGPSEYLLHQGEQPLRVPLNRDTTFVEPLLPGTLETLVQLKNRTEHFMFMNRNLEEATIFKRYTELAKEREKPEESKVPSPSPDPQPIEAAKE